MDRYLKWGPFRVRPGITLTNLGYDNNILYQYTLDPRPAVGDYTATVSPKADAVVLFGDRAFFTFNARFDYTAYFHNSSVNYGNVFTGGRLTVPFRRWGVYADLGWDRIRDRPAELQSIRPTRTNGRLGGGFIFQAGWRTDLEFGLTRSRWTADDPTYRSPAGCELGVDDPCFTLGDLWDRVEKGIRVKARYLVVGRTRLTGEWGETRYTFDDPEVLRDGTDRRLLLGVSFGEGGRLLGAARLGPARVDLTQTPGVEATGIVGNAQLAYRYGSGSTLQFAGRRDVRYSVFESSRILFERGGGIRVVQYFNRMLGLELGGDLGKMAFQNSTREDTIRTYDVAVRVRMMENDLGRRVEYSLRLTRYDRQSNVPIYDFSRTLFGFGATFGY